MKLLTFIAVAFMFSVCNTAQAQSLPITEQVMRHYNNMSSLQATFTQELHHKESKGTEKRSGVFIFKKPLLVFWDTQKPSPETLIISAKEIWNVFPDEKLAYKYPIEAIEDSRSIIRVITGQSRIDETFSIENEANVDGLIKLHLFPHEPVQSLTEAFLWVEPSGLIKKIMIIDFFGNTNTIVFSDHRIGTVIDDKKFVFTPPKDYEVEVKDRQSIENRMLQ